MFFFHHVSHGFLALECLPYLMTGSQHQWLHIGVGNKLAFSYCDLLVFSAFMFFNISRDVGGVNGCTTP